MTANQLECILQEGEKGGTVAYYTPPPPTVPMSVKSTEIDR